MAYDLRISIAESSLAGQAMQRMVVSEHITPEQAAAQLLNAGAKLHGKKTPAEEMLGAFSSPEDVALMDEVMEIIHARRLADVPRDFGL